MLPIVAIADAVEVDGIFYNLIAKGNVAVVAPSPNGYKDKVVIPNVVTYENVAYNVKTIGDNAFQGCSSLTSVIIPESITTIGNNAFYGCSSLISVILPENVTSIGSYCFRKCSSLKTITIPKSFRSFGYGAFYRTAVDSVIISDIQSWCYISFDEFDSNPLYNANHFILNGEEVTDLIIPSSITGISSYSFCGCTNLKSITIPNSVRSIGNSAFLKCSSVTELSLSNNLQEIGRYAFEGCKSLSTITIPNSIEIIDNYAFRDCLSLTTLSIGRNISKIYTGAFANCTDLADVYCFAPNVPYSENIFDNSFVEYATLHVPSASVNAYKAAAPWREFKEIVEIIIPTYTLKYLLDGEEYKTYQIEEDDIIIPEDAPIKEGYTFSGWSEIPAKMPAHDVTVTGTFSINKYKLTYKVDGKVYKTYDVEFGTAITPEEEPIKEGYKFSGWSEIPKNMPAKDITITGTFTVNKYKLTYKVDDEVYKTYDVKYGATITPEAAPTKEGYTFSGWSDIPATMPAHDVTVTGTFTQETGIEQILGSENGKAMIFTIDGKRVDNMKKGLNVIRMKDGTIRKAVVK